MLTKVTPPYIDPAGDPRRGALPVRPPFVLRDVTARVFPLKANIARLTEFCDSYLNMDIPDEIVHYRPALPYVYLMVLNYGSMSPSSVAAQNVGWVAQHEVTFTVPLQKWRRENGRLVFKDWATVTPFIFVDDEVSQATGREVYGWPKILAKVDSDTPQWAGDPRAGIRLFTLSTHTFARVYAGQREDMQVLLHVDRDGPPMFTQMPPDLANRWLPLTFVPSAIRNSLSLIGDAADILLGLRLRGFTTDWNPGALLSMAGKGVNYLGQALCGLPFTSLVRGATGAKDPELWLLPKLFMDSVTLKQFRDPEDPRLARHVALINSQMGIDRLNRCGLLGDVELLRVDPSGGLTVRIHQYTSQPIVQSLGLEVLNRYQETDGQWVSVLKPCFPFWTDVDLYYGTGEVICARTNPGDIQKVPWDDHQTDQPKPVGQSQSTPPSEILYNTVLGAATAPVLGPFHFPDMTVQVYPLLADGAQLARFVDSYLNEPFASTDLSFKTVGSYVYLVVSVLGDQLGTMWSSNNNIGWWADREVAFCVPVKWYRGGELVSLAMIEPFVYANNGRAVITDREVNGRPSVSARIESPEDIWLTKSGPVNDRKLLHMTTEIFPALNVGQRAEQRTLLDIDGEDVLPYNDDVGWRKVAEGWGRDLVDEIRRKIRLRSVQGKEVLDAKALALEVLAHEAPLNRIVFKQYRAAGNVELACYQAAVHTPRSITAIYDLREIETRMHVRLHRAPGHPIAEVLGLKVKSIVSKDGNVIDNIQPLRPFWMRIGMKEELGTVIGTVTGMQPAGPQPSGSPTREWCITHPWFNGPAASDAGRVRQSQSSPYFLTPGGTRVGSSLLDDLHPQNLKAQADKWLRRALLREIGWLQVTVRRLGPDALQDLHANLSRSDSDDLRQIENSPAIEALCQAFPAERLVALGVAVRQARPIWPELADMPNAAQDPQPAARLATQDATTAIDTLEEMQLVLDSILSNEWEHWGNPRFFRGKAPKPENAFPPGSIGTEAAKDVLRNYAGDDLPIT